MGDRRRRGDGRSERERFSWARRWPWGRRCTCWSRFATTSTWRRSTAQTGAAPMAAATGQPRNRRAARPAAAPAGGDAVVRLRACSSAPPARAWSWASIWRSGRWRGPIATTTMPPFDGVYRGGAGMSGRARLANRWTDGAAMIADGRVLRHAAGIGRAALPRPAHRDACCGSSRAARCSGWRASTTGAMLLVGNRKLTALRLDDGKPAWDDGGARRCRAAPSPSGNGFLSDGKYYLPADHGRGGRRRPGRRARLWRGCGRATARRWAISFAIAGRSSRRTACFSTASTRSTCCARDRSGSWPRIPTTSKRCASLGEIAYNEGRLSEAIELVERAYRAVARRPRNARHAGRVPGRRPRRGLRRPIARGCRCSRSWRTAAPWRPLQVLRIEAQGLLAVGRPARRRRRRASSLYRRGRRGRRTARRSAGHHETAVSRWVQAQLAAIWDAATADAARKRWPSRSRARPRRSTSDVERRRARSGFLSFFGSLPDVRRAQAGPRAAARRRAACARIAATAAWTWPSRPTRAVRREAVARIAAGLHAAGLARIGARVRRAACRRVRRRCRASTARRAASLWRAGPKPRPSADVDVADGPRRRAQRAATTAAIAGARAGARVGRSAGARRLDSRPRRRLSGAAAASSSWQDGLRPRVLSRRASSRNRRPCIASRAASTARRAATCWSCRWAASWRRSTRCRRRRPGAAAALWRASLGSNFDYQDAYLDEMARETPPSARLVPRAAVDDSTASGSASSGRSPAAAACSRISAGWCASTRSRATSRWSRTDVPPGCDLFGDDRYVFATPSGSERALGVQRRSTAARWARRTLPPWERAARPRAAGRSIRWSTTDDGAHGAGGGRSRSPATSLGGSSSTPSRSVDVDQGSLRRRRRAGGPRGDRRRRRRASVLVDQQSAARSRRVEQIHLVAGDDSFVLVVEHPPRAQRRPRRCGRSTRSIAGGRRPGVRVRSRRGTHAVEPARRTWCSRRWCSTSRPTCRSSCSPAC